MKEKKNNALIFGLWALLILIVFNISLSRSNSNNSRTSRQESYDIKATYLVRAGIMKMLVELAKDTNSYDSLNEDWNRNTDNPKKLILKDDTIFYGASDESGRLNLNSATLKEEDLLGLGIDEPSAKKILEYKNKKGAKGFEFIEELFLVDGVTRKDFSEIKDWVTIYRGTEPRVNINTASRKVLEALVGRKELVQKILNYRKGLDREEFTDDDGFKDIGDINAIPGLDPDLFVVQSTVFRIWSQFPLSEDKGMTRGAEAIIGKRSGKIYHWKEY
ncbi:type II secretion system protein GspK [Candidatus Omnitrophota bacterium]